MEYIIGISAYYHDSSACLFKDGNLLFACEEEKFSGIKHDDTFPHLVIDHIFKEYKLSKKDIGTVCYYEDPELKLERVKKNNRHQKINNLMFSIKSDIKTRKMMKELKYELSKISDNVFYSTHHESHLYYSYYTSDFNEAVCFAIDGVGEKDTISYGVPSKYGLTYDSLAQYPHSLGLFYSAMTSFLGFRPNEGEYKVMGLSSYGNPVKFLKRVKNTIKFDQNKLECNMDVFTWNRSDKMMFNRKLEELLGIRFRVPDDPITQKHMDLAAAVQKVYEDILFEIITTYPIGFTGNVNLCLGGGCAYNGLANGKITQNTPYEHIWAPPAPSDAGSAVGACIHYLVKTDKLKGRVPKNPFLGPNYDDYDIREVFKGNDNYYHAFTDEKLVKDVAKYLSEGKVVGWFRGHMEFGARALGHRSIFADPTAEGMKDRINQLVKKREGFRPFAPMVTKESQHKYFEMTDDIPYMNQVVKVRPEYRDILKAVTHVDGTARVQTVYKHTIMHDLLLEFEKLTGFPILLNTSLNVKDKTMVLTPRDALWTYNHTDIDILIMWRDILYRK